jgi:hypothetical protein
MKAASKSMREVGAPAFLPGTKIFSQWEYVDKKLADRWLAMNNRNRDLIPALWSRYLEEMSLGQWFVTHQGVAFDEEGFRVDGNHRLKAISEGAPAQWLLVTRGLSKEAVEAIDRGKMRSMAHALQVMGLALSDTRDVAMARAMYSGPLYGVGYKRPTEVSLRKFIERHAEAMLFVRSLPGFKSLRSPVHGVLARAYYHVPTAELTRFVRAMTDDLDVAEARPGDRTARALAAASDKNRHGGSLRSLPLYRRAQNALRKYLDGVDVQRLDELDQDLFPLPEGKEPPDGQAAG